MDTNTAGFIDLKSSRLMVALKQTESVTAAAEILNVTPSTLSIQLKMLEEKLGRRLFKRDKTGMKVTGDGESFLFYAEKLLELNHDFDKQRSIVRISQGAREVRVGFPDVYSPLFSEIHSAVQNIYADVKLSAVVLPTRQLNELLESEDLDIVLGSFDESIKSTTMESQPVKLGWMGSKNQVIKSGTIDLAVADDGCVWRARAIESLNHHTVDYTIRLSANSFSVLERELLANPYIAPLPILDYTDHLEDHTEELGLPTLGHYYLTVKQTADASALVEDVARCCIDIVKQHTSKSG